MNILVYSDTHGNLDRAIEMYDRLNAACRFDLIIHCGDHASDAVRLSKLVDCDVVYVYGNCDGCMTESIKVVNTPAGKILITHGHNEQVKYSLQNLVYKAMENECVAVCYGHTHVPVNEKVGGVRVVNPGSLTRPRGGSAPSCAIMVATEKGISASIIKY